MPNLRTGVLVPLVAVALAGVGIVASGWVDSFRGRVLAQAGPWTRQFGTPAHDAATGVAVAPDGNVYATGWTDGILAGQPSNAGARDAFLRKYSASGALTWTRQFGTVGNDVAADVSTDGAAVYVSGVTSGALPGETLVGETDAFVRKYDAGGTLLWTRQFGSTGRTAAAARVLLDGTTNLYVAGWTTGTLANQLSAGGSDAFVRKYDANGSELWTRQFGTPGHDRAGSMATDGSGAVFVLGQFGRPADTFVRKYAADGTEEWTSRLDTPDGEFVSAMTVDAVGNIYVAGQTGGDEGRGFARKYAPDGVVLWKVEIGRPASTSPVSMITDIAVDASGVYLAGHAGGRLPGQAAPAVGAFDIVVLKVNPDRPGVRRWTLQLASPGNDILARLAIDGTGIPFVVGWSSGALETSPNGGGSDAFLARLQ